jgi:hypothetical protein
MHIQHRAVTAVQLRIWKKEGNTQELATAHESFDEL